MAKNFGLDHVSERSDWIILLDADTILAPHFLNDLERYFTEKIYDKPVVGTTRVRPLENKKLYARLWFALYNIGHAYTCTSFAIQIKNARLGKEVRFDPKIAFGEDLQYIKDSLHYGHFFFIPTDSVETSTRRCKSS